jgi:SAM-dependent methyltransferase
MEDSVTRFYDLLASDYHLLFEDWPRSVRLQGEVLEKILFQSLAPRPLAVLDCCCGIGTQAIGLALRGHRVVARDVSPRAVERARREAADFGVSIEFAVSDLRDPAVAPSGQFDAVLACDNALPHLLTEEDLAKALGNVATELRPGGLFVASIRDYDELTRERPRATPVRVFDGAEGRRIAFQVWDWSADGKAYRFHQFIVSASGSEWRTASYTTDYRALLRNELTDAIDQTGLDDLRWLFPPESGYYQPVVTARKPTLSSPPRAASGAS